jgi:DNA polymerase V
MTRRITDSFIGGWVSVQMMLTEDMGIFQMNMFIDYEALERYRRLQGAIAGGTPGNSGANAVFKGNDLLEGATTLERNQQIGGHKA